MILLQAKSAQKAPMALELGADQSKDLKKNFSFLQLLKGFDPQEESKTPVVLDLKNQSKTASAETLQSLLQNSDTLQDAQLLNPKLVGMMDKSELTALIHKAKEYLRSQIEQSPEYKKAGIKELPQTLRSLVEVAQKFGLDITKISVDTQEGKTQIKRDASKEIPKAETKEIPKPEIKAETKETPKTEIKTETKAENKEIPKTELKQELKQEIKQEIRAENKEIPKQEIKAENRQLTVPLFKAQMPNVATTEQFVQIKQIQANLDEREAKSKTKTKDTLSSLLRQDKEMQDNPKFTADFSVATAKVIAPKAQDLSTQQNPSRNLESLLRDSSESGTKTTETTSKVETQSPLKAESFEVKLNEAKQMIKYLSSDVKNAIEEYKSPFTRVKLQLNPQRLGEIDLTIVQRGKNLHVNMSSNNTAINTLSVHMNELRSQLSNNGINNATFNFNSNSESSNGSADQGQQRQDQHKAHHEYGYFAEEETNEELARSLEIVVPQYI